MDKYDIALVGLILITFLFIGTVVYSVVETTYKTIHIQIEEIYG